MSNLPALGSRPTATPAVPAAQVGGKAVGAQAAPASGNVAAPLPIVDGVSTQHDSVRLSRQSTARTAQLGQSTVDVAQKFINSFVKRLFGDAAKGADVQFDAVSLEANSSYTSSASYNSGTDGVTSRASFELNESARFTGVGQIATDDGQTFDFEIEVRYEAKVEASLTRSAGAAERSAAPAAAIETPDVLTLTGKPLPAIEFPGSLNDLFALLGRQLSVGVDQGDEAAGGGNLTMRLMRLVDRAALLAPRAQSDDPQASALERNKALASYAATPSSNAITSA